MYTEIFTKKYPLCLLPQHQLPIFPNIIKPKVKIDITIFLMFTLNAKKLL